MWSLTDFHLLNEYAERDKAEHVHQIKSPCCHQWCGALVSRFSPKSLITNDNQSAIRNAQWSIKRRYDKGNKMERNLNQITFHLVKNQVLPPTKWKFLKKSSLYSKSLLISTTYLLKKNKTIRLRGIEKIGIERLVFTCLLLSFCCATTEWDVVHQTCITISRQWPSSGHSFFNPPTILLSFLLCCCCFFFLFGLCFIRSGLGLYSDSRTNNLPRCTDVDRRRKRKRTTNEGKRRTRNESKKQSVKDACSLRRKALLCI